MKNFTIIALLLLVFSCGKSNPDTTDIYIPDINGNWLNQADNTDQFSFFDAPNGAATGTFSGHEFNNGTEIADITGNFTHSKVTFKVTFDDNSKTPVTYSGTISGTTNPVMSLNGSPGKLSLKKQ